MLPTRPLDLRGLPVPDESVPWLKLLHRLRRIVDEREASALATAILCPEAEARDLVFGGFVEFAEFLAQFVFAHVRAAGVEDVTEAARISIVLVLLPIVMLERFCGVAAVKIGDNSHDHLLAA